MANDVNMVGKSQPKKTSWNAEEVNNIIVQYQNQIQQYEQYMQAMQNQIKELEIDGIIKRVDILFQVLKHADLFGAEYVNTCVEELKQIITLPTKSEVTEVTKVTETKENREPELFDNVTETEKTE